jgi:hypothetical protein
MPRDARAYLQDIVDCCTAISGVLRGIAVRDVPILRDECQRLLDDS